MKKHTLISVLTLSFILTSCSTTRKSVGLGLLTGASTGYALQHGSRNNRMKSLAVGALVGGIASYFIHQGLEKRDAKTRKKTLFNLEKFGVYGQAKASRNSKSAPFSLSPAMVEEGYIETHQDGKRLIEGHRVWTISEESQWMPRGKK